MDLIRLRLYYDHLTWIRLSLKCLVSIFVEIWRCINKTDLNRTEQVLRKQEPVWLARICLAKLKHGLNDFTHLPRTDTEARADPSITLAGSWISVSSVKAFPVYRQKQSSKRDKLKRKQRCHIGCQWIVDWPRQYWKFEVIKRSFLNMINSSIKSLHFLYFM